MSILTDFQSYIDGNSLLAPNPVPTGTLRGSDNGPCFTSEYIFILNDSTLLTPGQLEAEITTRSNAINACINSDGYLTRAPGDTTLGNPDNHFGVYAFSVITGLTPQFRFYWQLLRMPQLYFASRCASKAVKWYKPWYWPLAVINAIIIATSCIGTATNDTDPRRLAYLLIRATAPYSLLARLASKIWFNRLTSDYPNLGMKGVYQQYFQPNGPSNPYANYVNIT